MITNERTEERVLKLIIEKGARLVFHYHIWAGYYDPYTVLRKVTLEHNGRELTLSNPPEYKWDDDEPRNARCELSKLYKHPEIKEVYPGYRGDYDRDFKEVYAWKGTPDPWWVEAQVDIADM